MISLQLEKQLLLTKEPRLVRYWAASLFVDRGSFHVGSSFVRGNCSVALSWLLPSLAAPLWDTSGWLPPDSVLGTLLHGLAGYDARPAGMQILFFAVVLVSIVIGMKLIGQSQQSSR